MITVDEARGRILAGLTTTGAQSVSIAEGLNRVLAAPVIARLTQPPADMSAMDGYALRAADALAGEKLKIIGAAPAGHPFARSIGPGEAVRLFTGSVVPEGADCVLMQENVIPEDVAITITEAAILGRHIRRKGQDFDVGDLLIEAGRRLTARDIGLAAAANHPWLQVHRRPRIAILSTGDEISLPGEPLSPGGIVSSNAHALAALITQAGGEPIILPIAGDDLAAIGVAADAAKGADMLVTTGGASVGAHDLVQEGLKARGMRLDFWKIAMRPGKPLLSGHIGALPVLGLPGNPVSAIVCAILFLIPAIERLSGLSGGAPLTELARLCTALPKNDQREDYIRASLTLADGAFLATPFQVQDSGMMRALAAADALIKRPAYDPARKIGESVEILRLS